MVRPKSMIYKFSNIQLATLCKNYQLGSETNLLYCIGPYDFIIVPCNNIPPSSTYVIRNHQRHGRADRQTDVIRRQYRSIAIAAWRGKNRPWWRCRSDKQIHNVWNIDVYWKYLVCGIIYAVLGNGSLIMNNNNTHFYKQSQNVFMV